MTLRKWFYLFWTTLLIGAGVGLATGLILGAFDQDISSFFGSAGIGYNAFNMFLAGATISVLSQMGFFAYLIVRYIFMGIIRSKAIFDILQMLLIIVVLFDLVYLRAVEAGTGWAQFLILPLVLLIVSVATSLWKVKMTNKNAFLPTLFFMIVVTTIEAVPALRLNSASSTLFMMVPLVASNVWQILLLHKIVDSKKS